MEVPKPYEDYNTIQIVQDQFPELILSSDSHDLEGAMACAEYLSQERPLDFASSYLLENTNDVLAYEGRLSPMGKEARRITLQKLPARIALKGLDNIVAPIFRKAANKNRAIALLSLAEYKIADEESLGREAILEDFRRPMKVSKSSRDTARDYLGVYYRELLQAKRELSENEILAISAGMQVANENKGWVTFPLSDKYDEILYRRLLVQKHTREARS
jgi:hypothetical protein